MADKSKKDKFGQNPFKSLKGFCASTPKKAPKSPEKMPEKDREPEEDDSSLFVREMKRLGLDAEPRGDLSVEESQKETSKEVKQVRAPLSDRELFLAALGKMETTFSDEIPAEEENRAEPRRMRLLRKGKLAPEASLDLHGFSRTEARQKVRYFLDNAVHHGQRTVLLVTGRGKSSGGEPVVRAEIELYLETEGKPLVSEWGRAPKQFGGDGALIVFLRGEK